MSERKYRFVSPGVFVNEVDNSQLPNILPDIGPVIIGRSERGPAMIPTRVNSTSEFIELFGNPIPGGKGGDVWREGNYSSPTYGAYAAIAYLRAGVGPVTYVRLLGEAHPSAVASGYAGWSTKENVAPTSTINTNGGAFGLFLFASSSSGMTNADVGDGRLAAVWYTNSASVGLSGADTSGASVTNKALGFVKAVATGPEFKVVVSSSADSYTTSFNFDRNSSKYIRNVFNTNPQLLGAGTSTNRHTTSAIKQSDKYWLGQTYERFISDAGLLSLGADVYGIILPLHDGQNTNVDAKNFAQHKIGRVDPSTGWVFSQNTSTVYDSSFAPGTTSTQNLFKLVARNHAEWASKNLKVSIIDINPSTNDFDKYGTFTVQVRRADDTDNVPQVIEQFTGCNLNPASENYIAKKIGDKYVLWDETQKVNRELGEYDNQSRYIYVTLDQQVSNGVADPILLPFGFAGPLKPKSFKVFSGSISTYDYYATSSAGTKIKTYATGSPTYAPNAYAGLGASSMIFAGGSAFTASFLFPTIPLRVSASDGGISNPNKSYFGIQTTLSDTSKRYDPGYVDLVKPFSADDLLNGAISDGNNDYSFMFTLDNISGSQAVYVTDSAKNGTSLNAVNSSSVKVLESGYNRFTMPLYGGHDGVDIVEQDPFCNGAIGSNTTETTSYALYTVKRAVDSIADAEFVEANLISVPGVTQPLITDQVISVSEQRADMLAVIDLEGGYIAPAESTSEFYSRVGSTPETVLYLKNRRLNSSYACSYYPWVRIKDDISNASLWVPPSVIALGTFASSEAKTELWFAPAGFTRGGLNEGAGGWPVLSVIEKLRSEDRDSLYEANVNPIASFPSQGIVIFGQKTLQVTPSALDRINVRRLMIYLKKKVSRIASSILFDQNVRTTWNRFKSETDKFLGSVQARLGLTEFRVVLDETTTTPDLIDRNILYAKIYLKPARSIEFIAIDFAITKTGASFDD